MECLGTSKLVTDGAQTAAMLSKVKDHTIYLSNQGKKTTSFDTACGLGTPAQWADFLLCARECYSTALY